jgi:hypothetical protein
VSRWNDPPRESWPDAILNGLALLAVAAAWVVILLGATSTT